MSTWDTAAPRRHPRSTWPGSLTRSMVLRLAGPSGSGWQPRRRARRGPAPPVTVIKFNSRYLPRPWPTQDKSTMTQ